MAFLGQNFAKFRTPNFAKLILQALISISRNSRNFCNTTGDMFCLYTSILRLRSKVSSPSIISNNSGQGLKTFDPRYSSFQKYFLNKDPF